MKRKRKTNSRIATKTTSKASRPVKDQVPLAEHLREVKRRLVYVVLSVAVCSAIVYGIERKLIDILLRPSHGQHFVYTSPLGGINFLFNVCFYFGIALSVPIIIYNLLKFLQPLMHYTTEKFIVLSSISSGVLAICGVLFGYFAGLPAALHFLLKQQFHNGQVEALINIQDYFSFVVAYMFGAALMFQLPLLLIILNRIKPLTPKKMLKYERAVILFSFISAFIMNPTPNVVDQMLTVVPVLISYQIGILIVWLINKRSVKHRYRLLFDQDGTNREARLARAQQAIAMPVEENAESLVSHVTKPAQEENTNQKIPIKNDHRKTPHRTVSPQYLADRAQYASSGSRLVQL